MLAKRLESLIANEYRNTDIARRTDAEMIQRFQCLRDDGLLPTSRGKNAEDLSEQGLVAGLLSIVTRKPGYTSVAVRALMSLRPVGGRGASFGNSETFGAALAALVKEESPIERLLEVRISDSEIYTNAHGRGVIVYKDGRSEKSAYYVHQNAMSLMAAGSEKSFNPRDLISSMITETLLFPTLFRKIANELKREKMYRVA
jgi:hypothetical protein